MNLTIRLDEVLHRSLDQLARRTSRTRSEPARFGELRGATMPFAQARGYLDDEDVFRDAS